MGAKPKKLMQVIFQGLKTNRKVPNRYSMHNSNEQKPNACSLRLNSVL
jgi:hypothetical protein